MIESFATITKKMPPKKIVGDSGPYTLFTFEADVDFGSKRRLVVFSAFKAVGAIAESLLVGEKIKIEWYVETKFRDENVYNTQAKASWIQKIN
jgi:hypothetical protein